MDFPIKNDSDHELELGLEPEGDSIPLAPGDRCVLRFIDATDLAALDLDVEYRGRFISVSAMASKEVFVNGKQVR